jgi:hypothetical protein
MSLFSSAGSATASAGPNCTTGSSGGNVNTCFTILGAGLFVGEMHATAQVINSDRSLFECIHGPDPALPVCTDVRDIPSVGVLPITWNPNRTVTATTSSTTRYCARTWRQNTSGSPTLIGEVCFDVHP